MVQAFLDHLSVLSVMSDITQYSSQLGVTASDLVYGRPRAELWLQTLIGAETQITEKKEAIWVSLQVCGFHFNHMGFADCGSESISRSSEAW